MYSRSRVTLSITPFGTKTTNMSGQSHGAVWAMGVYRTCALALVVAICCTLRLTEGDGITLPDQVSSVVQQQAVQPPANNPFPPAVVVEERNRNGKNLLDFVGLGTGANLDPYHAKTNANCLRGELADCFKSQAIGTFEEFFNKVEYRMSENVRISRVPEQQYRSLEQEPYEFSTEPRDEEPEWDQLVKFGMRKMEKFLKSAIIEVDIPNELTEGGRYSPRFIGDGIADELDIIEDKHAPLFRKNKLKKLFIPMLIILKLFKLKLLLFLPLILGLASFKKLLGFAAIVVPGLIGYFKLCRPQQHGPSYGQQYGSNYNPNSFPQYSAQGVGAASYNQHVHYEQQQQYREDPQFAKPFGDYFSGGSGYGKNAAAEGNVRFGEQQAQDLAYQGQPQYRNKNGE